MTSSLTLAYEIFHYCQVSSRNSGPGCAGGNFDFLFWCFEFRSPPIADIATIVKNYHLKLHMVSYGETCELSYFSLDCTAPFCYCSLQGSAVFMIARKAMYTYACLSFD